MGELYQKMAQDLAIKNLERYQAVVLSGSEMRGHRTSYRLRLGPWRHRSEPEDVEVPAHVYRRTARGDTVVVRLRPGLLGIRWISIVAPR